MLNKKLNDYMLLESKLKEYFHDRIDIDEAALYAGMDIAARLDSTIFIIRYVKGEKMMLLTPQSCSMVLEELVPVLNEIYGEESICSYIIDDGQVEESATVEWDSVNPEKRIADLVNGRGHKGRHNIINLQLTNGRDPDEYLDDYALLKRFL